MDLGPYVDRLRAELAVAAAAGGPEAVALADRLTAPLESAARLVLLEALSEAADRITHELAPGSVDVRLRGRDADFVVTPAPADEPDDELDGEPSGGTSDEPSDATSGRAADQPATADGGTSRVNLRLPEALKLRAERAAGRERLSVNTWLVRAVETALRHEDGRAPRSAARRVLGPSVGGDRYSGWVR